MRLSNHKNANVTVVVSLSLSGVFFERLSVYVDTEGEVGGIAYALMHPMYPVICIG